MRLPPFHAHHTRVQKSVLQSLLWLTGIVWAGGVGVFASATIAEWMQVFLATTMGVTILAVFVAYAYFARRDPDRLHTEEHRRDMRVLQLLGDDRTPPDTLMRLLESERVPNPRLTGTGNE